MRKIFTPIFYIINLSVIYLALPAVIIPISWIFIKSNGFNICCMVILGELALVSPIILYNNRENATIVITEKTIENYMNDRTHNFGGVDILNI